MPDPVLEQALREAYASAPADTVILHTIELRHPAFDDDDGRPTAIRVVRDHVDLTARLEATAPLDAGETVWFVALAFDLELPPVDSAPMPEISVTLDNVGREIVRHLDAAATSRARIEVTYAMPPGASSAGWARAAPPAERRLRSGTLRAATAARIAADGGDEAVCRVDRQTQGYQAACGLHEVGLRVPTVPGPARARSRCQQHGEHRSNRSQGAECGATVLRRGDRAGQGYRRSRRGQGKCGRDVEMDRHEPAPQVGGPWRGCGILQACVDGEKKNPPIEGLRAEFVDCPLVARNIVCLSAAGPERPVRLLLACEGRSAIQRRPHRPRRAVLAPRSPRARWPRRRARPPRCKPRRCGRRFRAPEAAGAPGRRPAPLSNAATERTAQPAGPVLVPFEQTRQLSKSSFERSVV